jgi:hypothetical protein
MNDQEIMFQSNINGCFPWPLADTVAEGKGDVLFGDVRVGEIFGSCLSTDLKKSRNLSGVSCILDLFEGLGLNDTGLRFDETPDLETNFDRKLGEELKFGLIVSCC